MPAKSTSITLKLTKSIIWGFLLGFITVFIIEHFGNFSYMEEASTDTSTQNEKLSFTRDVPLGSKVSRIHLLTPYIKVISELIQNENFDIIDEELLVVLPKDKIVTASRFYPKVYEKFQEEVYLIESTNTITN